MSKDDYVSVHRNTINRFDDAVRSLQEQNRALIAERDAAVEHAREYAILECAGIACAKLVRQIAAERDTAKTEAENLAKFKAYVHQRLDEAGVPIDPDSPHKAEGCRIGGRLDFVLAERDAARAERDAFKKSLETIECGAFNGADIARAALRGDFKPVVKVSTP